MGIDTSGLMFPKSSKVRPEVKREKRLDGAARERACRLEVWRRYGRKCAVPGCKESAVHQHHIVYRSRSVKLRYEPSNRAPLCTSHHRMEHAGKITIHPRDVNGELLVTGEAKYLRFRL